MSFTLHAPVGAAILASTATLSVCSPAPSPIDEGPVLRTPAPAPCAVLHANFFDVDIDETGNGNISVGDDGAPNCDEAVVLWSFANGSAAIDNHDPIVDELILQVSDLEAAGPAGIDFSLDLDPCWAGFQVLRDSDTLVHEEMIGDGCEMVVDVDFTGEDATAEIHVVQQTGTIQPPHIWTVSTDSSTTLTGLPDGTWFVKVFDGFTPGSAITTTDGLASATDTLYFVPDGAHVDVSIATPLGFTTGT